MSNSQQMKKGLSVRDLITTGILAALYMVCAMIGEAIFGFFPVLTFLCPLSIALLCGPVYMLILAKVPRIQYAKHIDQFSPTVCFGLTATPMCNIW